MNLAEYVRRRNGVPMGANHSLRNMLSRSFGAGKFSIFWKYWNPIWSYYLGKFIFKPFKIFLPSPLSLILTFGFCGFLHDLVIMLLRWDFALLFTPWFLLMGLCVVLGEYAKIDYSKFKWNIRAVINILIISCCLFIAYQLHI